MTFAYHFEAKQLQSFIFSSSKLRDASGASEIVNRLAFEANAIMDEAPQDLASEILKLSKLEVTDVTIHRRAGGVLTITANEEHRKKLIKFRALWRLHLNTFAPGMAFVDGIGTGEDANTALLAARKSTIATAPAANPKAPYASPLVRMAPRTGRPPVPTGDGIENGICVITKTYIDEETRAKRQILKQGNLTLPSLFAGNEKQKHEWPLRFEENDGDSDGSIFPYLDGVPKRVAIIHVDGNGVGQLFQRASKHLDGNQRRELSRALYQATLRAVQSAVTKTILLYSKNNVVPARPILLGGDDLTLVVRADLALEFVRTYITAFEYETQRAFCHFKNANLPKQLTAKAGIVFLGVRQPFAQGYQLCESLASAAKHADQSRVSFARLTSAVIPEDAQSVQESRPRLWQKFWSLDTLAVLEKLAAILQQDDVGRGALRRVPDLIALNDITQATAIYRRSLDVLKKRNEPVHQELLAALQALGLTETCPINKGYCPLLDAHDLGQVTNSSKEDA